MGADHVLEDSSIAIATHTHNGSHLSSANVADLLPRRGVNAPSARCSLPEQRSRQSTPYVQHANFQFLRTAKGWKIVTLLRNGTKNSGATWAKEEDAAKAVGKIMIRFAFHDGYTHVCGRFLELDPTVARLMRLHCTKTSLLPEFQCYKYTYISALMRGLCSYHDKVENMMIRARSENDVETLIRAITDDNISLKRKLNEQDEQTNKLFKRYRG
ncbi:hypothetical protein SeMB42_g05165 [Synchytrium endobioticum]|uniref:Uncharacterized protein n=1 Tax=Synchytrium endobioticum TaxID=286115 RepID=A0A507CTG6_9FUNG|nr:hypothetical protein SeMB42_g05165 [Synchytrium endobioticum]